MLLVCALAAMEIEPVASAGFMTFFLKESHPIAQPDNAQRSRVREDLAAVQIELMQVMRTDPATTQVLEQREKQLKYALRVGQFRPFESTACRDGAGTPQS